MSISSSFQPGIRPFFARHKAPADAAPASRSSRSVRRAELLARMAGVGRVANRDDGGDAAVRTSRAPSEEVLRVLATVEAPAQTRRFVGQVLQSWGCHATTRDDLVLVVSELVSEAARYPLAVHVEVRLTRRHGRVELAVSDLCPEPPSCANQGSGEPSVVRAVLDSCSEHWDWSRTGPVGRTVWAYVAC